MKSTVIWRPTAESRLADLWLEAPHRDAVTQAADKLDRDLAQDPTAVGESRGGNTRVVFEPPLGIYCDVFKDDQLVVVWMVWETKP